MKSCQFQSSQPNLVTVSESPSNVVMVKRERLDEEEEEERLMSGHEQLKQTVMNMSQMAGMSPFGQMALQGMAQVGHPMQSHLSALQVIMINHMQ